MNNQFFSLHVSDGVIYSIDGKKLHTLKTTLPQNDILRTGSYRIKLVFATCLG